MLGGPRELASHSSEEALRRSSRLFPTRIQLHRRAPGEIVAGPKLRLQKNQRREGRGGQQRQEPRKRMALRLDPLLYDAFGEHHVRVEPKEGAAAAAKLRGDVLHLKLALQAATSRRVGLQRDDGAHKGHEKGTDAGPAALIPQRPPFKNAFLLYLIYSIFNILLLFITVYRVTCI